MNPAGSPHLTAGVWTALRSDHGIDRERVILEGLLLRMMIDGLRLAREGEFPPDTIHWDAERIQIALSWRGAQMLRRAFAVCDERRAELLPALIGDLITEVG